MVQQLRVGLTDIFNIQHYKPNGGYKAWHFERHHNEQLRIFAFMTYLNDVPDGGTDFLYQDLTLEGMSLANIIRNDFPNLGTLCNCGGGKFNSQMKKAYSSGADVAVILEEESCDGKLINAKIRRLDDSNESKIVKISDISKELRDFLKISDG